MLKDGFFSANEVTEFNIRTLSSSQSFECERRICELSELADETAEAVCELYVEGYGVYEISEIISSGLCIGRHAEHSSALEINKARLVSYINSLFSNDRAVFSALLVDAINKNGISLNESTFFSSGSTEETFVYVKNPLADEAYDVFSQDFSDPRVSYARNLKDAARLVSAGKAEYCLLPLEERSGVRIASVAELIFAEDLKINAVTPVFGFDGSADMKYALFSRYFKVPRVFKDDDRYLEIRVLNASALSEIFVVAEQLGVAVHKVNTVSFDTEDGLAECFDIVFKKNGEDFVDLIMYLTLFCPTYTAIGIYNNLE